MKKSKSLILGSAQHKVSKFNQGKNLANKAKKQLKKGGKGQGKKTLNLGGKLIKGKKFGQK